VSPVAFDSWAILALLRGEEPARGDVRRLLDDAANTGVRGSMCLVNAGEVYYIIARARGRAAADRVWSMLAGLPVDLVAPDDELVLAAARLKARYPIAYADAFAAAMAIMQGRELVTGDPELAAVEAGEPLRVRWLSRR